MRCDSAGVGRTGTLIAIDYLLNQAACEKQVDILACIDNLRRQRMSSVQNVVSTLTRLRSLTVTREWRFAFSLLCGGYKYDIRLRFDGHSTVIRLLVKGR